MHTLLYRVLVICMLALPALIAMAVEENTYRLSAQDKITVNVLKHEELSQSYTIPPDGVIDFPRVGRMNVIGKTTSELAAALKEQLAQFLRDPVVTVALQEARLKTVNVLGAVVKPGQYPLTAGMRITELLAAAGDLAGDREGMTAILMRGKELIPVNLTAAVSGNNPAANLPVQEGDLLLVQPPEKFTVVVSGQVKTPGTLKMLKGSNAVDALAMAGDLLDRPERMVITLLRAGVSTKIAWGDKTQLLQDGDVLLVEKEPLARIFVNGQVKNPGAYELPPGGGVLEAITLAGGTSERPALSQVTILRAKDGAKERVNLLPAIKQGNVSVNPKLFPGDNVIVPEYNTVISVLGKGVNTPGTFPVNEGETITVTQAIALAGGQSQRGQLSQTAVIRLENGEPKRYPVNVAKILGKEQRYELDMTLQPRDIVYVPETSTPDWTKLLPLIGLLF